MAEHNTHVPGFIAQSERVEWRNVYAENPPRTGEWRGPLTRHKEQLEEQADDMLGGWDRIAVERIETRTTITRYPISPHAGEETKG